jgi:hypothetical protein
LRHGGFSGRTIEPLAEQLASALLKARRDLTDHAFAVAAWAQAETRAALLRLEIDRRGIVDEAGEPRESLLKWLHGAERRAAEERRNLGLDPSSRARLERDTGLGVSIAAINQLTFSGLGILSARDDRMGNIAEKGPEVLLGATDETETIDGDE